MEKTHEQSSTEVLINDDAQGSDKVTPKLPYKAPVLAALGDVRDMTMGNTPGLGESGTDGTIWWDGGMG